MAKSDLVGFDPAAYAPVAERIRLFWESFPNGRITTRLVSRTDDVVVFEARVYRATTDSEPAATGWAAEREGDGDVNTVACLENTETSAVGRALANLGFTAAKERPSAEEMQKAARVRAQLSRGRGLQRDADALSDTLDLLRSAERLGLSATRVQAFRRTLVEATPTRAKLQRTARVLRRWVAHRARARVEAFGPTRSRSSPSE